MYELQHKVVRFEYIVKNMSCVVVFNKRWTDTCLRLKKQWIKYYSINKQKRNWPEWNCFFNLTFYLLLIWQWFLWINPLNHWISKKQTTFWMPSRFVKTNNSLNNCNDVHTNNLIDKKSSEIRPTPMSKARLHVTSPFLWAAALIYMTFNANSTIELQTSMKIGNVGGTCYWSLTFFNDFTSNFIDIQWLARLSGVK